MDASVVLPGSVRERLVRAAARSHVLVVGSLNVDTILRVGAGEPADEGAALVRDLTTAVGGHAGNCAVRLAALGLSVSVVGAVGADTNGDRIVDELRERGVDAAGVVRRSSPTGEVTIPIFEDKHYMLLLRGANDDLRVSDLDGLDLARFDAVMLFDPPRGVVFRLSRDVPTARRPLCWTPGGVYSRDRLVAEVAPQCDVVLANEEEHAGIRDCGLGPGFPGSGTELVVTSGKAGARLCTTGTELLVQAEPVGEVDPTGAGDAFAAAYLHGRLAGLAPEQLLTLGNRAGARAVRETGAHGGLSTVDHLLETNEENGPDGETNPQ